jgi:ABC-type lipoprotein release transport system permease subunit
MFFFLKLALGNVIKNKRNTMSIITVVIICVFFMQFVVGYMDGFKQKLINDAISQTGHITVYNKGYYENLDFAPVDMNLEYNKAEMKKIADTAGVQDIRSEINFGVVANTEADNKESMVKAIDPSLNSASYDKRRKTVKEGRFPEKNDEILIGIKMARLLKAGIGDKIIMMTMDQYGSINAVEGKVSGIFRNYNPSEESGLIICTLALAQKLLALEGRVTELIVNVNDYTKAREVAAVLEKELKKGMIAVPWQVESAFMVSMLDMMNVSIGLLMAIIIAVAGMGITNSFLMNIMGRLPEFGVLRAMGLGKGQMFGMIMAESFTLGIIGSIAGMIPGALLVYYFQVNPINYESMGEVFDKYEGLDASIGTALTMEGVILVFVTGVLVALAASIYPAITAIIKKPVEILRVTQ